MISITKNSNALLRVTGIFVCALILLITVVAAVESDNVSASVPDPTAVHFFYSPLCYSCHKVMPFIEEYEASHPDVRIQYHNIGDNQDDILLFETFRKMHPEEKKLHLNLIEWLEKEKSGL